MRKLMTMALMLLVCTSVLAKKKQKVDLFPDGTPIPEWFRQTDEVDISKLGKQYKITDYGVINDGNIYTKELQTLIDKIAAEGVTAEELDKVKKFELKSFNDKQRENGYWQGLITSKVNWNKDTQKDYEKAIQSLSSKDVQNFVKNVLLKQNNCITVSMLPEDMTE